jgi:hypothetical protein
MTTRFVVLVSVRRGSLASQIDVTLPAESLNGLLDLAFTDSPDVAVRARLDVTAMMRTAQNKIAWYYGTGNRYYANSVSGLTNLPYESVNLRVELGAPAQL